MEIILRYDSFEGAIVIVNLKSDYVLELPRFIVYGRHTNGFIVSTLSPIATTIDIYL